MGINRFFMKKRQILAFLCTIVATFILATSLRLFVPSSLVAQANSNLLISAAASLKESLEEVKSLYRQTKPNVNVSYNFGASGALQQQIENGAPADIFISAAKKQMDALQSKGLIIADSRRNLLTNSLVLIVPRNSSGITGFRQLTDSTVKKIAVGEPRSVPAGQYAEELFNNLGIFQQVKPKLVLGNNVRQVLSFVESGNADAGLVYATDAKISQQVKQVAIAPANSHSPIVYPVAVLKSSKNGSAAREYVQFLSSNRAGAIFQKYGFGRT
jgi:molybdate transport system substrate-binding protein